MIDSDREEEPFICLLSECWRKLSFNTTISHKRFDFQTSGQKFKENYVYGVWIESFDRTLIFL